MAMVAMVVVLISTPLHATHFHFLNNYVHNKYNNFVKNLPLTTTMFNHNNFDHNQAQLVPPYHTFERDAILSAR